VVIDSGKTQPSLAITTRDVQVVVVRNATPSK